MIETKKLVEAFMPMIAATAAIYKEYLTQEVPSHIALDLTKHIITTMLTQKSDADKTIDFLKSLDANQGSA